MRPSTVKKLILALYLLYNIGGYAQSVPDGFAIEPIHDGLFERIKGKSFKDDCTVSRDSLRYIRLLHYDFNGKLREFMMGEVRFSALTRTFPERAEVLFKAAEEQCAKRYAGYKAMAD